MFKSDKLTQKYEGKLYKPINQIVCIGYWLTFNILFCFIDFVKDVNKYIFIVFIRLEQWNVNICCRRIISCVWQVGGCPDNPGPGGTLPHTIDSVIIDVLCLCAFYFPLLLCLYLLLIHFLPNKANSLIDSTLYCGYC